MSEQTQDPFAGCFWRDDRGVEVMNVSQARAILAARLADANARLAAVEGDTGPDSFMETLRDTLTSRGIDEWNANWLTSVIMGHLRAALHPDPSEFSRVGEWLTHKAADGRGFRHTDGQDCPVCRGELLPALHPDPNEGTISDQQKEEPR